MPVIGIDLGTDNCVIALARRGGIDVVVNEFSRRYTPSIVSFTNKERYIGEAGLTQAIGNATNTVQAIKRLIGIKYSQAEQDGELKNYACNIEQGPDDSILINVTYLGEKRQFTPVQILAMIFGQLINYIEKECGVRNMDCAIAIPGYFTDVQRRAVLQAAEIAGIHCIRLINDTTAAAIEYGIYKELEDKPINIAFVDVGHGDTTVSIAQMSKGNIKVLASAFERHLGAGHFEQLLVAHFAKLILDKYKIDALSNGKARARLNKECERVKKVLSANSETMFRVESIMNDIDVNFKFTREEFESMSQDLLRRFEVPVKKALEDSKIELSDLHSIELLGGGSYIPSLKNIISTIFQKPVSTTLNSLESIARGCAIQAAILSPSFNLARQMTVADAVPYGVSVGWVGTDKKDSMETEESASLSVGNQVVNKSSPMFKLYEATPSSKILTFSRNKDFDLFALYTQPEQLPAGTSTSIGKFSIQGVPSANASGKGTPKIKVKVRHNIHGVFQIEDAHTVDEVEVEVEEEVPEEEKTEDAKKKDDKKKDDKSEPPKKQTRLVKKMKTVTNKLQVKEEVPIIPSEQLKAFVADEKKMSYQDKMIRETAEAKNDVESYIYAMRDRITDGGNLYEYLNNNDRKEFNAALDEAELWLEDEVSRDDSVNKLKSLKKFGDVAEVRIREEKERPAASETLEKAINEYRIFLASSEEKYSHIAQDAKDKVAQKVSEVRSWLDSESDKQSRAAKNVDPTLTVALIQAKEKELRDLAKPIVNTPKPKPKVEDTPAPSAATPQSGDAKTAESADKKDDKMDESS
ncbi:HSP70 [Acrasis kona]|uniref:HSP70 n=1 Tax=Acrasis kona TaxID=1008807 RepID=A0AAW2Z961_9EUKA